MLVSASMKPCIVHFCLALGLAIRLVHTFGAVGSADQAAAANAVSNEPAGAEQLREARHALKKNREAKNKSDRSAERGQARP
jgi:hypothetical protein